MPAWTPVVLSRMYCRSVYMHACTRTNEKGNKENSKQPEHTAGQSTMQSRVGKHSRTKRWWRWPGRPLCCILKCSCREHYAVIWTWRGEEYSAFQECLFVYKIRYLFGWLVIWTLVRKIYRDITYDLSRSSRLSALQLRPFGICLRISTIVAKTSPSLYASRAGASMWSISAISWWSLTKWTVGWRRAMVLRQSSTMLLVVDYRSVGSATTSLDE